MSESQTPMKDEAEKPEIMYQSACSGLWYENEAAAGTLKAIRIGSRIYALPNIDPIITELTATRARLAELEEKLKDNREREEATERELCRVSDVACDRAIKLAELEVITERLYQAAKSGHVTSAVALDLVDGLIAYEAYKEGKK